jgi:predicted PhzF superfamily epimerase YddE/YHI9
MDRPGVIVSGPEDETYDFVSRYFAPAKGIPEDPVTGAVHCMLAPYWAEKAARLARELIERGPLPSTAVPDALHISVAVSGGVGYFLTWNFKHLANTQMRSRIDKVCSAYG